MSVYDDNKIFSKEQMTSL